MKRKPNDPQDSWVPEDYSQGRVMDIKTNCFVDGEGVRTSVYFAGCLFNCPGCYNKVSQQFHVGEVYDQAMEDYIIESLAPSYVQGLTLLGGSPFMNAPTALKLCKRVREVYGNTKDIWAWSGATWNELINTKSVSMLKLLRHCDILVDGRFLEDHLDLTLHFRGSGNQRIIDVQESLANDFIVLYKDYNKDTDYWETRMEDWNK